jgi:hypothetical protein
MEKPIGIFRSPAIPAASSVARLTSGSPPRKASDPFARAGLGEQAPHRGFRYVPRHLPRRAAEAAAFGVAVGAAEVAALGHCERQRADRGIIDGLIADEARETEAMPGQQGASRLLPLRRRRRNCQAEIVADLEDLRAVDDQKMRAIGGVEQVEIPAG